jgi:hypothetical protein
MIIDWTIGFVNHVGPRGSSIVVEAGLLYEVGREQSNFALL